jgi:hypothetical protein
MAVGTAALPASALATGSGVLNMVRQAGAAIGVAIFVAIVGAGGDPSERLAAFDRGWWVLVAVTVLSFIPLALFMRQRPNGVPGGRLRTKPRGHGAQSPES